MSLKCINCGNIFDECEAGVHFEYHDELSNGEFEKFNQCPCCGSDEIDKTVRCRGCKEEFLEEELCAGYYCDDCLKENLTYETFLEFATTGVSCSDHVDTMEDFVFTEILALTTPYTSSYELKRCCKELYKMEVANEKFLQKKELMDKILSYFSKTPEAKDDFAEYLYSKKVKK